MSWLNQGTELAHLSHKVLVMVVCVIINSCDLCAREWYRGEIGGWRTYWYIHQTRHFRSLLIIFFNTEFGMDVICSSNTDYGPVCIPVYIKSALYWWSLQLMKSCRHIEFHNINVYIILLIISPTVPSWSRKNIIV